METQQHEDRENNRQQLVFEGTLHVLDTIEHNVGKLRAQLRKDAEQFQVELKGLNAIVAQHVVNEKKLQRRVLELEAELKLLREGENESPNKRQRIAFSNPAVVTVNSSLQKVKPGQPICSNFQQDIELNQLRRKLRTAQGEHQDTLKELKVVANLRAAEKMQLEQKIYGVGDRTEARAFGKRKAARYTAKREQQASGHRLLE